MASHSILKHPILDEPTALDSVSEVMVSINLDKTFASADKVLNGDLGEPGVVDADKLQASPRIYVAF
jgi:hypothetical protein